MSVAQTISFPYCKALICYASQQKENYSIMINGVNNSKVILRVFVNFDVISVNGAVSNTS